MHCSCTCLFDTCTLPSSNRLLQTERNRSFFVYTCGTMHREAGLHVCPHFAPHSMQVFFLLLLLCREYALTLRICMRRVKFVEMFIWRQHKFSNIHSFASSITHIHFRNSGQYAELIASRTKNNTGDLCRHVIFFSSLYLLTLHHIFDVSSGCRSDFE